MKLPIVGVDILNLIPQRAPIVMIDALLAADTESANTALSVTKENIFVHDNHFQPAGILEHIAQSCAAFLGWLSLEECQSPQIGYIGEIKSCEIGCLPKVGQQITTRIKLIAEIGGVRLVEAESSTEDGICCSCQMKLFIQ